jgi:hypothetical protein
MKKRYKKQYKPIKHFTVKFLFTLAIGMICGLLPIIYIGGQAIILGMATSIMGTSVSMLCFGLVQEDK